MLKKIINIIVPVFILIATAAFLYFTASQRKTVTAGVSESLPVPETTPLAEKTQAAKHNQKSKKVKTSPNIEAKILANTHGLDKNVLDHALTGYHWAVSHGYVRNPDILTIVDFSMPSYEKRLWVVDVKSGKQLMNLYTTHGSHSGMTSATSFSNRPGSNQSSVGVFVTMNPYQGKHGLSERLKGLEPGINSNAYARAIVIHPAWYATPSYIASNHRAGRSWGCFALDPSKSTKYVNLTKNGTVLYAYGKPEEHDPIVA